MFTAGQRIVLIMILTIVGGVSFATGGVFVPIMAVVGCLLLAYGYFRYGTVVLAFRALRKGELDRAEELLKGTHHPARLASQYRSFYFWVEGALAAATGDAVRGERCLLLAYRGRLRTSHNRCVVGCCLADLAIRSGRYDEARAYLKTVRREVHRSELDPIVEKLESELPEGGKSNS